MRAFLAHSSKDKGFVDGIVELLRPGSFELDTQTFDFGLVNAHAILNSLERSDLFCLILSSQSATSAYVDFETLLGVDLLASGNILRFLAICIDDTAFDQASRHVKYFNLVRKITTPDAAARLIQGQLVSAAALRSEQIHPFIGREDEIKLLGHQVDDHSKPLSKALYISGNFGSGRRTIARHFYKDYFPHVNQTFPTISLEPFTGLEELYRAVLAALRPSMPARSLLSTVHGFQTASVEDKTLLVCQQFNSLLSSREAACVIDKGGVLTDAGALIPEIDGVLAHLDAQPHPPIVFISPRMIPRKLRRTDEDISYLSVTSLSYDATEGLISRLHRSRGITISENALERLIQLSDSHPFNVYRIVDEVAECGVDTFLANPSTFIDWKHRQSSEYIEKIIFGESEVQILAVLKLVPELDFTSNS